MTDAADTPAHERDGVTSLMVPIPTTIRAMLTACRKETQRRDPRTVPTDQAFASAIVTSVVLTMHATLFPKLIETPRIVGPNAPIPSGQPAPGPMWRPA